MKRGYLLVCLTVGAFGAAPASAEVTSGQCAAVFRAYVNCITVCANVLEKALERCDNNFATGSEQQEACAEAAYHRYDECSFVCQDNFETICELMSAGEKPAKN